jgi:hypothetical protein
MRASIILTVGSALTFVAAFVTRQAFFADVAPISWDQEAAGLATGVGLSVAVN